MLLASGQPSRFELQAFHSLAGVISRGVRWLFDRDAERPGHVNARVLREILKTHADSEYGREHGFGSIENVEEFTERVPLITYRDIEARIERMAKGETNVLSGLHTDYFMLTSGTSRAPKLIPTNEVERRRRIPFYAFLPQGTLARRFGGAAIPGRGMNGMSIASSNRQTESGVPVSSSLRIGLAEHSWLLKLLFVSPVAAYRIADVEHAYYAHWLFALLERDLTYVSDEFASKMSYALAVLVRSADRLVRDLEQGSVDKSLPIEADIRAELEAAMRADPVRADEVRRAFAESPDGEGVLKRLWPSLRYVACIYTGTFGVYEERLRKYCGDLPVFNTAYGLSEACVGTALGLDDSRYVIYPRAGFLEFIREEDITRESPRTYTLDELELGVCYEVVVTNFAGLYRYRTSDVVRLVDYYKRAPVVEFMYRANVLMNLNAEMMTEQAAFEALKNAVGQVGLHLVEYTIRADTEVFPPRYVFYLELDREVAAETAAALDGALDTCLRDVNPRYADRIDRGRLQKATTVIVACGSFEAFALQIAKDGRARGISAVQTKIPRLLTHEPYVQLLEARTASHLRTC